MSEPSPAHEPDPAPAPAGKIGDDAQAVLDSARATVGAYADSFTALRRLFAAEVGLARDALVHALVYLLVATVMLGTAYLLVTALVVSGLRWIGAPWPLAIFLPLLFSVGVAALGMVRARAALKFADFEATRRQLKRDFGPTPGSDPPP